MSKHTPGPWYIPDWKQLGKIDVCFSGDDSGKIIAATYLRSDARQENANARLISAAPELLSACKKLIEVLNAPPSRPKCDENKFGDLCDLGCFDAIEAAIAKAEGNK